MLKLYLDTMDLIQLFKTHFEPQITGLQEFPKELLEFF